MSHFAFNRSCNDDFVPLYKNSNSNSNHDMDIEDPEINQLTEHVDRVNLNTEKRKREYVDAYAEPVTLVVSMPESEYNYDEDAMIQDDEDIDDEDLFQIKHRLPEDNDMDISDSEEEEDDEEEIDANFDELHWLRAEIAMLRAEAAQKQIAFPDGSSIRFTMIDGTRYLQVCQYVPPAPALTLDDLNCDSDDDEDV